MAKRKEIPPSDESALQPPVALARRRAAVGTKADAAGWSWRIDGWLAAVLVAVSFIVFANSLSNGWVYDDALMIEESERIKHPYDVALFFRTPFWENPEDESRYYRPLTAWSFALDQAWLGHGPAATHWVNVLVNCAVAVMAFVFLRAAFRDRRIAFIAALLFSIHPIHTEVVANGAGRADVASTFLIFAAAWFHLRYLRRVVPGDPSGEHSAFGLAAGTRGSEIIPLACAMVCYFMAILFKELAATLPGLLFLVEWLTVQRGSLRAMLPRLGRYFIYAIPLGVSIWMRYPVVGFQAPTVQLVMAESTKLQTMLFGSEVLLRQIGQLLVPIGLCADYVDYTRPVKSSLGDPLVLLSLVAWGAAAAWGTWLYKRRQFIPLFGLVWFFMSALPSSNIIIRIASIRGDRFMFLPSLGFVLIVAWFAAEAARRRRLIAYAAVAVVLVLYEAWTVERNRDWKSKESLWTVTLRTNPGNATAHAILGDCLLAAGRPAEAIKSYETALDIFQKLDYFHLGAGSGLASALHAAGRSADAAVLCRRIIEKAPDDPVAYLALGLVLMRDAETRQEAVQHIRRGIQLRPDNHIGYVYLAAALELDGQYQPALEAVFQAEKLNSADPNLPVMKQSLQRKLAARKDESPAPPGP
ncbi:tetratricopeptide repeat protein [Candidatus Poribacteria bacterium]|nr:tetratricopeptide repeat protein [Candidatus Poribacteria bacterium]